MDLLSRSVDYFYSTSQAAFFSTQTKRAFWDNWLHVEKAVGDDHGLLPLYYEFNLYGFQVDHDSKSSLFGKNPV